MSIQVLNYQNSNQCLKCHKSHYIEEKTLFVNCAPGHDSSYCFVRLFFSTLIYLLLIFSPTGKRIFVTWWLRLTLGSIFAILAIMFYKWFPPKSAGQWILPWSKYFGLYGPLSMLNYHGPLRLKYKAPNKLSNHAWSWHTNIFLRMMIILRMARCNRNLQ